MTITMKNHYDIVNYLIENGHSSTDEFIDLVENIISRIEVGEDEELTDAIYKALDEGLIYYDDQWTVLKEYCYPTNADWDVAFEEFFNTIQTILIWRIKL